MHLLLEMQYLKHNNCECAFVLLMLQGAIFSGDSPYYLWLVPTLGHSTVVYIVNQVYSSVARKCTNLENHR